MSSDNNRSNEQRAKDQAYQEYLRLRENRSSRGHYVKDDTLYGEYFPSGNESSKNRRRAGGASSEPHMANRRCAKVLSRGNSQKEKRICRKELK